jgi:hypothetical protein
MTTTVSDLDGLFKRVYGKKLVDLVPKAAYIQGRTPLTTANKIGKSFEFPVIVQNEQGATYEAPGAGAFSLNAASTMVTQNAIVDGYQLVLRGSIDYEAAAKAVAGGEKAFASSTKTQVQSLMTSTRCRIEIGNLYGQSDSGIGTAASSANTNATTTVVTLSAASWADGIWAGHEGAAIEFRELGSLGTLVADGPFTVAGVDGANKALTVTGSSAGITALDAAIAAGGGTPHAIFFSGAYGKEAAGLDKIITNVGTLFGIDAATYSLWRGNNKTVSGSITLEVVNDEVATAVSRGLDSEVDAIVSPTTWAAMLTDQAALRRYDSGSSSNKWTNGANGLSFESQNGRMNIVPHRYVKDGDIFVCPMSKLHRVGAQDVSFEIPGAPGKIFRQLENNAGYEFRTYSNQNMLAEAPAQFTKISGYTV